MGFEIETEVLPPHRCNTNPRRKRRGRTGRCGYLNRNEAVKANPYELLGLSGDANQAQIEKRLRDLAFLFAPDRHTGKTTLRNASEIMKMLNDAKDVLLDADKRVSVPRPSGPVRSVLEHLYTKPASASSGTRVPLTSPYRATPQPDPIPTPPPTPLNLRPPPGRGPELSERQARGYEALEGLYFWYYDCIQYIFWHPSAPTCTTVFGNDGPLQCELSQGHPLVFGGVVSVDFTRAPPLTADNVTTLDWAYVQTAVSRRAAEYGQHHSQPSPSSSPFVPSGEQLRAHNQEEAQRLAETVIAEQRERAISAIIEQIRLVDAAVAEQRRLAEAALRASEREVAAKAACACVERDAAAERARLEIDRARRTQLVEEARDCERELIKRERDLLEERTRLQQEADEKLERLQREADAERAKIMSERDLFQHSSDMHGAALRELQAEGAKAAVRERELLREVEEARLAALQAYESRLQMESEEARKKGWTLSYTPPWIALFRDKSWLAPLHDFLGG